MNLTVTIYDRAKGKWIYFLFFGGPFLTSQIEHYLYLLSTTKFPRWVKNNEKGKQEDAIINVETRRNLLS